jgi:putative N6-adenine-specific DNA methylase
MRELWIYMNLFPIYCVCTPGLEPFLRQELQQLGLLKAEAAQTGAQGGGVAFDGDPHALYRANLWLRTASRVIVRLGAFEAVGFSELRRRAARLEWERYLKPGAPVSLRVTCHKSRLYHSDAVAERVGVAIGDRLGQAPPALKSYDEDEGTPPQLVIVRLAHDQCTISLDSSGELLHRRGYRLASAKAPLRETLAAGMLLACGWDKVAPLIDPFCGSGTIPIEAALLADGIAPGGHRRFAFMDWPGFDKALWQAMLSRAEKAQKRLHASGVPHILASDRDAGAIEMARANAQRAGVADRIEFACQAVSAIQPPKQPGWIVTNPPYGLRVSADTDLRNLYAQLGNVLRTKCPGWQVGILCSELALLGQTGLKLDSRLSLVNGGVAVKLARGII